MSIWWILLIFLIIATAIFIILFIFWPDIVNPAVQSGSIINISGFNQVCSNTQICEGDLLCQINPDTGVGVCKQPLGGPCNNLDDCNLNGPMGATICSTDSNNIGTLGTCERTQVGGLNQPCPCQGGLICVASESGDICKLPPDSQCSLDSECSSGVCDDNTFLCTEGRLQGQTCTAGSCAPGLTCSLGFCQSDGIISGQAGAFCEANQPPPPSSSDAPGCVTGLDCLGNECTPAANNLGDTCSSELPCALPLTCIIEPNQNNGQCFYNSQVNACVDNVCIEEFTCQNGVCQANIGQACIVSDNCTGGSCDGASRLYTWISNNSWFSLGDMPGANPSLFIVSHYQSETLINVYAANETGIYRSCYNRQNNILGKWLQIIDGQLIRTIDNQVTTSSIKPSSLAVDTFNNLWICYENSNNLANWDGLYMVDILADGSGQLVAFNSTPGSPEGQQFSAVGALIINSISVSVDQDILISGFTVSNPTAIVYRKISTQTTYQAAVIGSMGQFIVPNNDFPAAENFAYLNISQNQLLFKGQSEGAVFPQPLPGAGAPVQTYRIIDYSIYSNPSSARLEGPIWMVAEITSGGSGYLIFSVEASQQYTYPGYYGSLTRLTALPRTSSDTQVSFNAVLIQGARTCTNLLE